MAQAMALVTGAGGTIGLAIARALSRAGFSLAINDIDRVALERARAQLPKGTISHACDVADAGAVALMIDQIRLSGDLSVVVSNAGTPGRFAPMHRMDPDQWARTRAVHLDGAYNLFRAAIPDMVARGDGRLVAIASQAGLMGAVGSADYAVAKAGLINLCQTLAKELGRYGITANAVAPGMVATPLNEKLAARGSAFVTEALRTVPSGCLVSPDDIAATVAFLASAGAAAISGAAIPVDYGANITTALDCHLADWLSETEGPNRTASGGGPA